MKADLSALQGARNTAQALPSCSSCKSTASWPVGNVHTYLQKALEAESSSAGLSTRLVASALDNALAWRMRAAHRC